jgi:hypothetical protein
VSITSGLSRLPALSDKINSQVAQFAGCLAMHAQSFPGCYMPMESLKSGIVMENVS